MHSPRRRGRRTAIAVAGGAETRRRLARLLGVEAVRRHGHEVVAAAYAGDQVQVQVSQRGDEDVVFILCRAAEGRPALLRCGQLDLYYRGAGLEPALEAALLAVAPRALAAVSMEALAELFERDPEAGRPAVPVPVLPEEDQRRYEEAALLSTWGSGEVWAQFFAVAEIARGQLDSLDYFNASLFVQHSDLECVFITPQTGVPMIPLVRYPWEDGPRRIDWGRPGTSREPEPGSQALLTTDLDESDVILGRGPRRLATALQAACERAEGRLVFCSNTCVPVVSGEDVDAVVGRSASSGCSKVLFLTTTPESMQELLDPVLVDIRLEAESSGERPEPRALNLVGFPDDPATAELEGLLGRLGLSVNVKLLPALSPALLRRLPRAGLSVELPNALWEPHYERLRIRSRGSTVRPPAPYGRAATARWLRTVAEAAGASGDVAAVVDGALASGEAQWSGLRAAASEHGIGLVVRAEDQHLLTDPASTWGVPLLDVLAEMGFRVEVLLRRSGRDDEDRRAEEGLGSRLGERGRLAVFSTAEELRDLLSGSGLSACYSEHGYDRRLSELGLSSFCLQHLEPGFEGATRSLRRLLEVCSLPFSRRYGRYARRAGRRSGLPDPFGAPPR